MRGPNAGVMRGKGFTKFPKKLAHRSDDGVCGTNMIGLWTRTRRWVTERLRNNDEKDVRSSRVTNRVLQTGSSNGRKIYPSIGDCWENTHDASASGAPLWQSRC